MMKTRAQVTLFVILGIVLLLAVTIILYLQQFATNQRLADQARDSVMDFVEVNAINHYVTSCLDKVATEGLVLLGEQGGVIYDYQGGLTNTSSLDFQEGGAYLPYNHTIQTQDENANNITIGRLRNVSYAIQNYIDCSLFEPPYPAIYAIPSTSYYPVKDVYLRNYQTTYMNFDYGCFRGFFSQPYLGVSGFLGKNNIPRLCYHNGSNKPNEIPAGSNPCEFRHYDTPEDPTSIQRQLEVYVQNNMQTCVDFSPFTDNYTGYNITVNEEAISVSSVLQKPQGIVIKATYPFSVSVGNKQPLIEKVNFQTTLHVNIRQLYDYYFQTVINMVRDPFYNLLEDWNNVSVAGNHYYRNSFELEYERSPTYNYINPFSYLDDVLTITDTSSLLKGRPYSFTFAIKQRKPVLEYLHNPIQYGTINGEKIDYQFFTNSTIEINPLAAEPDYDDVKFTYKGWKEDYDEWLNTTCCQAQGGCNLSNHTGCLVQEPNPAPQLWTTSSHFNSSVGYSQIESNESDIGYHNVTVIVEDEHGYKDFQIVRILIFDLPVAVLSGKNMYDTVNNTFAAIEDIYLLNASNSTLSIMAGNQDTNYIFRDDTEGFHIYQANPLLYLANDSYDFFNVTHGFFNYTNLTPTSQNPLPHNISLVVQQDSGGGLSILSSPVFLDVEVAECLPYGYDPTNGGLHGYAASGISSNADAEQYYWGAATSPELYSYPHVCCKPIDDALPLDNLGAGQFHASGEICFQTGNGGEGEFITCAPSRDLNDPYVYLSGALMSDDTGLLMDLTQANYDARYGSDEFEKDFYSNWLSTSVLDDGQNDVYHVEYTQFCSDDRGNVCSGRGEASWNLHTSCDDFEADNQFARCQGPGVNGKPFSFLGGGIAYNCTNKNILFDHTGDIRCENFSSGHSYERDVLLITSDLTSTTSEETSMIEDGYCAPPNHRFANSPETKLFCQSTCTARNASCGTHNVSFCMCGLEEETVCYNVPAKELFDENFNTRDTFYCLDENTACDDTCSHQSPATTPEGCYCKTFSTSENGFSKDVLLAEENQTYFPSPYNSDNGIRCCAHENKPTIHSPDVEVPGGGVCYGGNDYDSDDVFASGELLACNGQIHCCRASCEDYNVETFFSASFSQTFCGHTCQLNNQWS